MNQVLPTHTHSLAQEILLTVSTLNSHVSDDDDEVAATVDGDDCFIFIVDNGCQNDVIYVFMLKQFLN